MAVYKQPKSKYWWYKFVWNGEPIRESTKQTNKRVGEQMEAAHRTALAKLACERGQHSTGLRACGLKSVFGCVLKMFETGGLRFNTARRIMPAAESQ